MKSFEDVRAHLAARHRLRASDPYFLSFDIAIDENRRQGLYLAELETENGRKVLRVSSPIAPFKESDAPRCLRFNWAQRVGFFAVGDLEGAPYLHLCENRPYNGMSAAELDRVVEEIGTLADKLEHLLSDGGDSL
jgi:hypothetical protein